MITILLAIIIVLILFSFIKPKKSEKNHFKDKRHVMLRKLWDIEFLRDQYKLTREGFRGDYDRLRERAIMSEENIKKEKEKKEPDQKVIKFFEEEIKKFAPDIEQLKKQIETIDLQTKGPAPAGGVTLNDNMENIRAVVDLLKKRIKNL